MRRGLDDRAEFTHGEAFKRWCPKHNVSFRSGHIERGRYGTNQEQGRRQRGPEQRQSARQQRYFWPNAAPLSYFVGAG
jgi:hypothetical protein